MTRLLVSFHKIPKQSVIGGALALALAGWIAYTLIDFSSKPKLAERSLLQAPATILREVEEPEPAEVALASLPKFDGNIHPATQFPAAGAAPLTAVRDPARPVPAEVTLATLNGGAPAPPDPVAVPAVVGAAVLRELEPPATAEVALAWHHRQRFVLSMALDKQGDLWLGTEDEGVWRRRMTTDGRGTWTQFTSTDGLGDDGIYAIACDHLGRVWVGHLNHGVSVYNGQKWQNYEVVGGISRPDSLSGPLGERIFAIKICPTDGDVWIASSRGLARYSEKTDEWTYITRAEGLPSDQVQAMDFDKNGNIYCGTQCDGMAMADASDGYTKWRQVTGPDRMPTTPTGEGLPTNLINDVLVATDGTVYAATTTGLAWSKDRGKTWRYVRGKDWADKVRGLYKGPPAGWQEERGAVLKQDYLRCLSASESGELYIGYRSGGYEVGKLQGDTFQIDNACSGHSMVTAIQPNAVTLPAVGSFGDGNFLPRSRFTAIAAASNPASLPSSAATPAITTLHQQLSQATDQSREDGETAAYIGEDWVTQGDWVGRYGQQHAILCAMNSPLNHEFTGYPPYRITGSIGQHRLGDDQLRHWVQWVRTDNRNSLYSPMIGTRRQAEWDDHGEAYPETWEGPDLWITLDVPRGPHQFSIYFFNKEGYSGSERSRDYLVQLRSIANTSAAAKEARVLASTRVRDFWGGVYKKFMVAGPKRYQINITRNYSPNAICSGVFIDRLQELRTRHGSEHAWLGGFEYGPSKLTETESMQWRDGSGTALPQDVAKDLWHCTMTSTSNGIRVIKNRATRQVLIYRAIKGISMSSAILEDWRWELNLWTDDDRHHCHAAMKQAWERMQLACPWLVQTGNVPVESGNDTVRR
jgi:hypothetical protein